MKQPLAKMIMKCSINYGLPLMYPDVAIGSMAYVKRIRTSVFYDYSYGHDILDLVENQPISTSESFYSFGVDVIADLHLCRFYFPFSLGIRISCLPLIVKVYPELLLSLDTSVF